MGGLEKRSLSLETCQARQISPWINKGALYHAKYHRVPVCAYQVMGPTRTAAANAERKVAARTIQVRRTDRGFGRASEQTLIDAGHAIYKPLWSANNEATLLAMIEKHETLLVTHEANPGAKEA